MHGSHWCGPTRYCRCRTGLSSTRNRVLRRLVFFPERTQPPCRAMQSFRVPHFSSGTSPRTGASRPELLDTCYDPGCKGLSFFRCFLRSQAGLSRRARPTADQNRSSAGLPSAGGPSGGSTCTTTSSGESPPVSTLPVSTKRGPLDAGVVAVTLGSVSASSS